MEEDHSGEGRRRGVVVPSQRGAFLVEWGAVGQIIRGVGERLPGKGLPEQEHVEADDDARHPPSRGFHPGPVHEHAHFGFAAGKKHQRHHRKAELEG